MLKGTDLSAIQGVLADAEWKTLADQGLRFAFLRAVVGNESWVDGSAAENAKRARAHGILAAPYVFPFPLPHLDATEQAEMFVRKLEGMGMAPDELPPMFDLEWPPREEWKVIGGIRTLTYPWKKWGCSASQIREWALECLDRCEHLTGMRWLVYSYRYFLQCIEAEKSPELADRPLVLADYTLMSKWPTQAQLDALKVPAPWASIAFCQHDGDGGMKLPSGKDADFDCFLGTEDDLRALTSQRLPDVVPSIPAAVDDRYLMPDDVRHSTLGLITDDAITDYRRSRIDVV
jgi:GH25 family lysozyme M1 (1,4-beta-N-acetylmuramidase)